MRDAGHKPKKRDGTTKSGTGGHPRDVFVALELRQTAVRLKSCLFQTLAVPLDVYNELKSLPLDKAIDKLRALTSAQTKPQPVSDPGLTPDPRASRKPERSKSTCEETSRIIKGEGPPDPPLMFFSLHHCKNTVMLMKH
ncbi:hypothetical protein WMY93_033007 [Mugilogobius chulae]|uniref:Uncharacterized protein n=1 Tax=Mugilogobius chulae TaxID=88201 RepID=A0AAW0MUP9_9GOBI